MNSSWFSSVLLAARRYQGETLIMRDVLMLVRMMTLMTAAKVQMARYQLLMCLYDQLGSGCD